MSVLIYPTIEKEEELAMASLTPTIDYANLTDAEIVHMGLNEAEAAFMRKVQQGMTNGDSLIIVVEARGEDGEWQQLGERWVGPDAAKFAAIVDRETGKLSTVLGYSMDSVSALRLYGDDIPEGAPRYTGGVHHTAQVLTRDRGWLTRDFAGAGSGVQGHFDMNAMYEALTTMGALWALKMQALYGKAA